MSEIEGVLKASGLPWNLKPGSRHTKIVVCGRMIAVVPRRPAREMGRRHLNLLSSLRRTIREMGGQPA